MIQSNNLSGETHYEIIKVKEDASLEEIRKAYRSAILNFHPDKLHKSRETSKPEHELANHFLEVQMAWAVLSDPRSRAIYDNDLRASRQDVLTAEDVSLLDITVEDAGRSFELYYHCRCGDYFSVDSSELAEIGYTSSRNGSEISLQAPSTVPASVVLPCGSCSLKIRLSIDANVNVQTELND